MRHSTNELDAHGFVLNGFDYSLQVWVKDGVVQACAHPLTMGLRCCHGRKYQLLPVRFVPGAERAVQSHLVDSTQPYQVRTGCSHIVIRRMRESTAGVPFSPDVIIEAPNGRPCDECERKATEVRS
jgi:hypothetical protein